MGWKGGIDTEKSVFSGLRPVRPFRRLRSDGGLGGSPSGGPPSFSLGRQRMPKLIGPTYDEYDWSRHPLWGRYKVTKGITLLVKGSVVTQVTYPWQGDLYKG